MESFYDFETRDEFKRKTIASNIIKIIDSNVNISPLVIDGDWGTGKTEFSLKLKKMLEQKENVSVVYIDAFKEDHADSPILSITAAISSSLPPPEKKKFIEKSIPAIKFGLKTTLKAGTAYLFRQNADDLAEEFREVLEDTAKQTIDITIEKLVQEHENLEENIFALKKTIETIASTKKIIIIADELDRCRPSYAVSFLENIKHIFGVDNIIFILVTNTQQLRASITHSYGSAVDAKKYLDKFVRYTINLPNSLPDRNLENNRTAVVHWNNILKSSPITNSNEILSSPFMDAWIYKSNISLRETETLFRHFEVYLTLAPNALSKNDSSLDNAGRILGVFLHCFCNRETIDNFPSLDSIHTMAKSIGLTTFVGVDGGLPLPLKEMAFYLYVKNYLKGQSTLLPVSSFADSTLEEIIRESYGYQGDMRMKNIIDSTFQIMSFIK